MIKAQAIARLALTGLTAIAIAGCTATASTHSADTASGQAASWPVTGLHYAPNGNFSQSGQYLSGTDGFNIADIEVDAKSNLDSLPSGVRGLVWLGDCSGVTASFRAAVETFAGDPKLFGFYVMDEPLPSNCPAANLLAEDNWIHAHARNAITFAILENLGPETKPTFAGSYTPRDSGLDLIGIDPYPVRSELNSPSYAEIATYVKMAEAIGWPQASIVPVYQTFGGGSYADSDDGHWVMPTATQERQILARWAAVVPAPKFDYAYSWGSRDGDIALSESPALRALFAIKNAEPSPVSK